MQDGKERKLKKIYVISQAAPCCFDIIINLSMLNELLLKRFVAPDCVIEISE